MQNRNEHLGPEYTVNLFSCLCPMIVMGMGSLLDNVLSIG